MNKIHIITDSASDIAVSHREDLTVLPMNVTFGGRSYRDGIDIDHRTFFRKLTESDEVPTTSLVSPGDFADVFEECAARDEEMIVITVSSRLSGTYQSALLAARDFANIHLIDSRFVTIGQQLLVQLALRLADAGRSAAEITAEVEKARDRVKVFGLLDTLKYVKRSGRISAATALIGGALNIKPMITVKEGMLEVMNIARGTKNGFRSLSKEIEKTGIDFSLPVILAYSGLEDSILRKFMTDSKPIWQGHLNELSLVTMGAAIGTHAGPGTVAVAYFEP